MGVSEDGGAARGSVSPSGFSRAFLPTNSVSRHTTPATSSDAQLFPGTGEFVGTAQNQPFEVADDERVHLNLVEASIEAAAKVVISDILQRNYIIDPRVSGKITIQTTNAIDKKALLSTFNTLLAFNGAALVERDDVVRIVPASDRGALPVDGNINRSALPEGIGQSVKIVPLDYVSAEEMARLLKPIVGEDKVLHVDTRRNILLLAGNRREMATALDAVNLFDIDQMKGMSFALLPIKNAEPDALVTELETIFATEDGGALKGLVRFVPNKRLSSILVISARPRYLKQAQQWVSRLDRIAGGTKRQLFVYSIQNREASELASLLETILADGNGTGFQVTTQPVTRVDGAFETAASANGNTPSLSGTGLGSSGLGRSTPSFGAVTPATPQGASLSAAELTQNRALGGQAVRVVADEANNAILIYATPDEYNAILTMLRQMDSLPNQVLLEATIAEVTLTDQLKFGLRWFFESGNFSLGLSDATGSAIGHNFPGFSFLFSGGQSAVALSALSSITDVNIISSPNLMVLDNRKAVLRIGDQVPIATQQAVDTTAINTTINTIELRDTGIILTVVPRVNDSGRVILDIEQEVSDVVKTTTSGIDSPTIRQRKVTTTVVVNDGDSLALGGLIQQRADVTKSQVPILGDVPLIGNLFRQKEDTQKRTELLILITPHVVRDFREANDVTDEFRKQLGGLRALGDKPQGGLKHKVQRLLR
ncbi:type II secretion system secretin GspD [Breoghania sp. L-A4]|uniref:type II secretion system secretin GspD n=1 Tax=Breoghania sp. L-A4 TaxID=2304600 RepID=UPI000E35F0D1|nr:type II secretion system secretin GspD [Breoghania sp. L-A4]AXS42394.1 type II secretion system protein GspD [Breoghania sp. L-A4]